MVYAKYPIGWLVMGLVLFCGGLACSPDSKPGTKAAEEENLDPAFQISLAELKTMIEPLPESIQARILARPQVFLFLMNKVLDLPYEFFWVVDKQNHLAAGYVPVDLAKLGNLPITQSRTGFEIRRAIIPDLLAMIFAARNEGIDIMVSSAYRSYDFQQAVYDRNVRDNGQETADHEVARPGASQHQLGTTLDFGSITEDFLYTRAGQWLAENAPSFGFTLSYPQGLEQLTGYKFECWHYRFITRPGAELSRDYFENIQYYFLSFYRQNRDFLVARRMVTGSTAALSGKGK